jgi:hypothetical protein
VEDVDHTEALVDTAELEQRLRHGRPLRGNS